MSRASGLKHAEVCRDAAKVLDAERALNPHPAGEPLVRVLGEAAQSFEEYPLVEPAGLRGAVLDLARTIQKVSC